MPFRSPASGYHAGMDNEARLPIENVYRVAESMTHSRPWVSDVFAKAVRSYVDDGTPARRRPPVVELL